MRRMFHRFAATVCRRESENVSSALSVRHLMQLKKRKEKGHAPSSVTRVGVARCGPLSIYRPCDVIGTTDVKSYCSFSSIHVSYLYLFLINYLILFLF